MPTRPLSFQNRYARSQASVARGIKPISNNLYNRLYRTPKPNVNVASVRSNSNNSVESANSNTSAQTWGSMNTYSYRAQKEKENQERANKQAKLAAFFARAKQGSPTGKPNKSWIKTRKGGRKSHRCWTRKARR
jgi:hypothetical protein